MDYYIKDIKHDWVSQKILVTWTWPDGVNRVQIIQFFNDSEHNTYKQELSKADYKNSGGFLILNNDEYIYKSRIVVLPYAYSEKKTLELIDQNNEENQIVVYLRPIRIAVLFKKKIFSKKCTLQLKASNKIPKGKLSFVYNPQYRPKDCNDGYIIPIYSEIKQGFNEIEFPSKFNSDNLRLFVTHQDDKDLIKITRGE